MYQIGRATAHECRLLPDIERRACLLFDTLPETSGLPPYFTALDDFEEAQAAGLLWVARVPAGHPVGFALVEPLGHDLHLEELDVVPEHARQGLGTALVHAVCDYATSKRRALTLTTFRNVPWNRPFYERLGFRVLEGAGIPPRLAERIAGETARGLPRELRVAMRFERAR